MRSDGVIGILKLGGRRERTLKRVSLETVLTSFTRRKSVVGVRVTVTVEFGPVDCQELLDMRRCAQHMDLPSDSLILIMTPPFHSPDGQRDQSQDSGTNTDTDTNDTSSWEFASFGSACRSCRGGSGMGRLCRTNY